MVTRRKQMPNGTFTDAHWEVRRLWYQRDLEPELLSGEPIPDIQDESDPVRERDARMLAASLLERCKPREAAVLSMRYLQEMTLDEVAAVLGVTRERVRQIEVKGIWRIRWKSKSDKNAWSFFA